MADTTKPDVSGERSLDEVLAEYIAGEEAGKSPDRKSLLARHPQFSDDLREFFANRDQMQRLAAPLRNGADITRDDPPLGTVRYFGDYELLEEVAAGGMGLIYRSRQRSLNRIVAVKMILKGTLAREDDVKRFRAEAEAAAGLQHPGIVAIHEVGLHEGQHYFSMDYVDGRSLAELPREQPLSVRQAAEYVRDAAEAVHYAHQQGTLHRDLKPSNILIDSQGRVRITDFGLAKRMEGDSDLTLTGQILGTPSYMSPEQASGKRSLVGVASDIYSLGAVLYELLAGRSPFRGETPAETLRQVETLDPVPPRLLNPAVPRDLQTICLKCLEKEPHKRYGTAHHLADDLGRYLRGEPIVARPIGTPARVWRWCRRNPVVTGLSAAVVSLVVGFAIVATIASLHLKSQRDTVSQQKQALEFQSTRTRQESLRARAAEHVANQRLYQSLINHARVSRFSRRAGQRIEGIKAISEAADLARQLQLGPDEGQALRDEYLACLSLVDLQLDREWTVPKITDWCTAFDNSLTHYVVRAPDGKQSIRRVEDGSELVPLLAGRGQVQRQAFSPDCRWLGCLYSGGKFALWEVATGHEQGRLAGVKDFSFSSDSQLVALSRGTRVETHRIVPWELESSIAIANVNLIAIQPAGKRVAVTVANAVEIWNLNTGEREQQFRLTSRPGDKIAWRPDGRLLAAGCTDYCIYVWDVPRKRQRAVLRGHNNAGIDLLFSHDGALLASHSWDGTTRLWDPLLGRELVRIDGLVRQFSQDDRRLAFDDGLKTVGIWSLSGNQERRTLGAFNEQQHLRITNCVSINRVGNLLAASGGDGVYVWSLPEGRLLGQLEWGATSSVQFDFADRIVTPSGSTLRVTELYTTDTAVEVATDDSLGPFNASIRNAVLSHDGRIAQAMEDSSHVAVLSLSEPHQPIVRMSHQWISARCGTHALSPDGRWSATMTWSGRGLKVWDTTAGLLVRDLWPENLSGCVAFSPDGRWLAATSNEELRIWQVANWKLEKSIPRVGRVNTAGPLAFSQDSQVLAVAMTRSAVQLLNPSDGQRLLTIEPPDASYEVTSFAFAPGGNLLAICYSDSVDLWDMALVRERLKGVGLHWNIPDGAQDSREF